MEKIPQSFESVDQYLGSYVFPLLEETRAGLASAMETIHKAPFAEVVSLTQLMHGKFLHSVQVDCWRNMITDRGREPYRTLPGDILLLSDLKPESDSDLGRVGWKFVLASVTNISEDENVDNCSSTGFKVRAAMNIDVGEMQSKSFYVVFLTNMTTNKRIWNALCMRKNLKIIEKVLCKNELVSYFPDLKGSNTLQTNIYIVRTTLQILAISIAPALCLLFDLVCHFSKISSTAKVTLCVCVCMLNLEILSLFYS